VKKTSVFVWHKRALIKIYSDDIRCLVVEGNYTKILISPTEYYMARCPLDDALKRLPAGEFVKIHRSWAVSINYIEEIKRDAVILPGIELTVSRQYYKLLKQKLSIIGKQSPPAKD